MKVNSDEDDSFIENLKDIIICQKSIKMLDYSRFKKGINRSFINFSKFYKEISWEND